MFFIRQNEVFIFFTWQYPHNKSRITPFSSNISVTIYRKIPNRARELKQRNTTFNPPPLCFAQQNIGEVSRSDGGVKPDNQKNSEYSFLTPTIKMTL